MNKQILFIEDNNCLRRLFSRLFERKRNLEQITDFTGDIKEAWDYLSKNNYRLLILDIRFPHDNTAGLKFLKELRDTGNSVPVVIYTGVPEHIIRDDLEGRNCITVISKNLNTDEVVERIEEAIFLVEAGITEESEHLEKLEELAVQFMMSPDGELDDEAEQEIKDTVFTPDFHPSLP